MQIQTDRSLIRSAGGSTRYALVGITAPEAPRSHARPPVNVAFVLDRSGSMGGTKIQLARSALVRALRMLRASDRFAVVFYDHQVDLIVPSTNATNEAVANAVAQVERIQARGSTDLAGGWLRGCEQVAERLDQSQIGRCLLLTDGLANVGIVDPDEIVSHAVELRRRGITTSTFGVGHDFNEVLLQRMSDAGGGRSYYVEEAVQIADYLTSELGETLETVARGAALRVRASSDVRIDPLNPFECRRLDDGTSEIQVGDLVSRQVVSLVLRLRFPSGTDGAASRALFSLVDAGHVLAVPDTDVVWTYAGHEDNDRQPRNVIVDREVARLYAAKAREEALELNRAGRYDDAQRRLKATADRIRGYAGSDSVMCEILLELEERETVYAGVLSVQALKDESYSSYNLARSRMSSGKSRRRPQGTA